jgi:hypothetical protein
MAIEGRSKKPERKTNGKEDEGASDRSRRKLRASEQENVSPYISPNELALRWRCSRSSVDRIAARAKLKRLYLGQGKNGMVRYLLSEVVAIEKKNTL